MNDKLKQITTRASRASKSRFHGSSSNCNRPEAILRCLDPELADGPITFLRSNDEEDEQCG
jgi:hypothetical protein